MVRGWYEDCLITSCQKLSDWQQISYDVSDRCLNMRLKVEGTRETGFMKASLFL